MSRAICWIRRDLRLEDHTALLAATDFADQVAIVFVFDPNILDDIKDRDDRRVTFIHQSLQELDAKLAKHGSQLIVRYGDPVIEIPAVAAQLKAGRSFTARDSDPYAIKRDAQVGAELNKIGIGFETVKDVTIFEGGEVQTEGGQPYRVYSPYARMWRKNFVASRDANERTPNLNHLIPTAEIQPLIADWSLEKIGFKPGYLWLEAGERAGSQRLNAMRGKLDGYKEGRDFPAKDAVSALSVHLRFGTVSIRQCIRLALESDSIGADKWLAELIWREFYHDILSHYPEVVNTTFQPQYASVEWPGNEAHFETWCKGETGYPIVDAAMRCLNATGWMHNRLRMIVASFLTKDLLLDYKLGEAYFAQKLLDFELASNSGGWQWASSVGCDPQPYFRIFNPTLQSLKFDPDGEFIRTWVPELAELTGEALHCPSSIPSMMLLSSGVDLGRNYPKPIVDHSVQRDLAVALLGSYKKNP